MFQTLRNAFKVKDIRSKIFYTFLMLVVVRLGSQLPIPGVDRSYFANWFSQQVGDAFNFFDAFTGGSFEEMSIFALNITPYITSSIIIELLTIAIPKLEEMQKDGEEGRKKLTAITRYVTVGLALLESIAMVIGFGRQGLIPDMTAMNVITVVVSLTAGSAFLMWVGERITEKGVGNGISIVLMINILSRVPSDITTLYETFIKPQTVAKGALAADYSCSYRCYRSAGYPAERCNKKYSGSVRKENAGKKNGWRSVIQHSSESKYSRCYSCYLCFFSDVHAIYRCSIHGKRKRKWYRIQDFERIKSAELV